MAYKRESLQRLADGIQLSATKYELIDDWFMIINCINYTIENL